MQISNESNADILCTKWKFSVWSDDFQSSNATTSMNWKNQNDSWSKRKRNDDSLNGKKRLAQVNAAKKHSAKSKKFWCWVTWWNSWQLTIRISRYFSTI